MPSVIQPGSKLDVRLNLASDYFLLPSCLEVKLVAKLQIREESGNLRNIESTDCLVPVDGLNFIKNVRPQIDGMNVIPPSKEIHQRLYRRVQDVVVKSNELRKIERSIQNDSQFFEKLSASDAENGKTHSHKYTNDSVVFKASNDSPVSKQSLTLAKMLTDEFICSVNFGGVAPFDIAKVGLNIFFCNITLPLPSPHFHKKSTLQFVKNEKASVFFQKKLNFIRKIILFLDSHKTC